MKLETEAGQDTQKNPTNSRNQEEVRIPYEVKGGEGNPWSL